MYLFEIVGIAIGVVVFCVLLLFIRIKCRTCRENRETGQNEQTVIRIESIPSYNEATKNDPPSYDHVVNLNMPPSYQSEVVQTSETMVF